MCVLSTLCGNVDKHSPFDIYIYIITMAMPWASSSSSSIACAQVIRLAHSGRRSSCCLDLGFLWFLLLWWWIPLFPLGFLHRLRIVCCIQLFHFFVLFWGSLVGYALGFLGFYGRICTEGLVHSFFCGLLLPLDWLIEQLYLSLLTSTSSSKNNIKAQME